METERLCEQNWLWTTPQSPSWLCCPGFWSRHLCACPGLPRPLGTGSKFHVRSDYTSGTMEAIVARRARAPRPFLPHLWLKGGIMEPRVAEPHEGGNVGGFFSLPRSSEREIWRLGLCCSGSLPRLESGGRDSSHLHTHTHTHTHHTNTAAESSGHRGRTV